MKMKTINYRGGLIQFSIPATWKEEYEETGGGTFYEDGPDTPTLRLNVLSFKTTPASADTDPLDGIRAVQGFIADSILQLKTGNWFAKSITRTTESGEDITIYHFYLVQQNTATHLRIADFSYTLLSVQENERRYIDELQELEDEVKKATFAREIGS
jgi:hypothetical protein